MYIIKFYFSSLWDLPGVYSGSLCLSNFSLHIVYYQKNKLVLIISVVSPFRTP